MKFSSRSVLFVLSALMTAFFVMRVRQKLSTEIESVDYHSKIVNPNIRLSDSSDNLIWFVQISDLHVSIFQEKERVVELREFCDLTLKVIMPPVVVVTGDLTDAKSENRMGSDQLLEEWKIYSDVLTKCGASKFTTWLDIRGNHDNFNVPGVLSPKNLFRKYSAQGPTHEKSYIHIQKFGNANYTFIGVDACPDQGLKRPLNFVGYLSAEELRYLKSLEEAASRMSNYTVWFGHYPTSCMVNSPGLRSLIGSSSGGLAYLCGHYHTLLNFVPRMHTIQKEHYLELELTDWKDNRMFRLAAIDHGVFSFVDVKHREWPVILVLNPKNSQYRLRLKEPHLTLNSTHVRILAFSANDVTTVKMKIDDGEWMSCEQHPNNKNLFIKEWNAHKFTNGFHMIHVTAIDQLGREKTISQRFSLDDSYTEFDVLPRFVLMLSFSSVLQTLFVFSLTSCVFPLCIVKALVRWNCGPLASLRRGYFRNWVRRLWLLSESGWLFVLVVFYPIYVALGPWAIGEVMDGHYGIIFIWGTYVNGQFVHELSTYGYGFIQLAIFHFPLLVFTSYALDQRKTALEANRQDSIFRSCINLWLCTVPFITILLCQTWMAFLFWSAYGVTAVVMSPVRTWPIFMTLGAWYYSKTFPVSKMRELTYKWKAVEERE
uniref:Transmembrane protein 62 n=1 Tax=Lygus hesperus TaxID=30085 RepID=A0A0A9YRK4_LYGHE